jgi:hypothetical protein
MEDRKSQAASDEFKVAQMVRVDSGCRINLQSVVVVCRILKETIGWVKDLMGEEEEKFSVRDQSIMSPV